MRPKLIKANAERQRDSQTNLDGLGQENSQLQTIIIPQICNMQP